MNRLGWAAVTLIATFFISGDSFAIVDPENANYSITFIDIPVGTNPLIQGVQRTYNSRSLHYGLFGFGWCSDIETHVSTLPSGDLELSICGAGKKTIFSKISDLSIASGKNVDVSETQFRSSTGNDVVRRTANGFMLMKTGGEYSIFDNDGRLLEVRATSGRWAKIIYFGSAVTTVLLDSGEIIYYSVDALGRISSAVTNAGLRADYSYSPDGDLIKVRNAWQNDYFYSYNTAHNLTKITYPGGRDVRMIYDVAKDWIISYKDDNCVEKYVYTGSSKHVFKTVATRSCKGNAVKKIEFLYIYSSQGRLVKHEIAAGPDKVSVAYDARGQLKRFELQEEGKSISVSVDHLGIPSSAVINGEQWRFFSHAGCRRSGGARSHNFEVTFFFDPICRLIGAKRSDGVSYSVEYDQFGRVIEISREGGVRMRAIYPADRYQLNEYPNEIEIEGAGKVKVEKLKRTSGASIHRAAYMEAMDVLSPLGVGLPRWDGLLNAFQQFEANSWCECMLPNP